MEDKIKSKENRAFLWLLIGLLFLRFPFLILAQYKIGPLMQKTADNYYEYGTYLLTALAILVCRNSLAKYHIDLPALVLFLAAPTLKLICLYRISSDGKRAANPWVAIVISVFLLAALLRWKPNAKKRSAKQIILWVLVALAAGACLSIVCGKVRMCYGIYYTSQETPAILLGTFGYQLGFAATAEEPLFRGFLWGFLKDHGWREPAICLFQTALFMLGHIYYLGSYNLSLFVVVPLCAFVFGILVWRSHSIGVSMVTHAFVNSTLDDLVAALVWRF